MAPALKKLYPNKEDLSDALKRHLVFFNTEGTLGGIIQGISLAMEEEKAIEGKIPGSAITSIKTGLMGPIAGMGDGIVWAVVMPVIFGIFIPFAAEGNPIGGIMPLILWTWRDDLSFSTSSPTMGISWAVSPSRASFSPA